jgi:hypothetical protein
MQTPVITYNVLPREFKKTFTVLAHEYRLDSKIIGYLDQLQSSSLNDSLDLEIDVRADGEPDNDVIIKLISITSQKVIKYISPPTTSPQVTVLPSQAPAQYQMVEKIETQHVDTVTAKIFVSYSFLSNRYMHPDFYVRSWDLLARHIAAGIYLEYSNFCDEYDLTGVHEFYHNGKWLNNEEYRTEMIAQETNRIIYESDLVLVT